ncbi:7,8-didemethyl-8-hydroxy-5-deazariboflavin synthase CofG [Micrococcaceae bacterium Sec5.1]
MARAEATGALGLADAAVLHSAREDELERLLAVASDLRDTGLEKAGRSGIITYSKKVFIPVTQLCQDRCHYCVFVETPNGLVAKGLPTYMSPAEILQVAREGAALGCKEALFTLGDRPESRWQSARDWLDDHGYKSTLDYIQAMAVLVLEETGLLPHVNPGVMTWAEMQRLRPVAPSMGMMLETAATRLWSEKGGVHYGSPDKDPSVRMRVLEDAGRSRVPFTTGVLLGIGETDTERAEALFAIRASHERHGHIQETIVQNFRAKPRTAMQNDDDLGLQEYVAAVAVARIVMGPDAIVQAPPNLTDAEELGLLIRAGINDWGGVSPLTVDHVNPERPWPHLEDLAHLTRNSGFELRERLTAHPQFIQRSATWIDERLHQHVSALAEPETGLASEPAAVRGRPWARADKSRPGSKISGSVVSMLRQAAQHPSGLTDSQYEALLSVDGQDLEALCRVADEVRNCAVGDRISFVANRNIDSSLYAPEVAITNAAGRNTGGAGNGSQNLSPRVLAELVDEAQSLGATEICVQGLIRPDLRGESYFDLVSTIRARQPAIHVHAFRPTEIMDGASRLGISIKEFLQELKGAGVNSVPGTGARILNDRIRAVLSDQSDPPVADWIDVITTAHGVGLPSTATMIYGHLESPADQVAHLRKLCSIQDITGGFTEFIAMPFLPYDAPVLSVVSRPGPGLRETRALHAVARLMLHGRIDHIQAAWTKLGHQTSLLVLQGGADDFGGLLIDGLRWPEVGAEAHRELFITDINRLASEIGRPVRQRMTDYSTAPADLLAPSRTGRVMPSKRVLPSIRESSSRVKRNT